MIWKDDLASNKIAIAQLNINYVRMIIVISTNDEDNCGSTVTLRF